MVIKKGKQKNLTTPLSILGQNVGEKIIYLIYGQNLGQKLSGKNIGQITPGKNILTKIYIYTLAKKIPNPGAKLENLTTPPYLFLNYGAKGYGAKIRVRFSHIWRFFDRGEREPNEYSNIPPHTL